MKRSFDVDLPTLTLKNQYFIYGVNHSRAAPGIPISLNLDISSRYTIVGSYD